MHRRVSAPTRENGANQTQCEPLCAAGERSSLAWDAMSAMGRTEVGRLRRMSRPISIGVIGDFNPEFPPHVATNAALEHAAAALGVQVEVDWLDTAELDDLDVAELAAYDALWGAPGSPYRSLDGALRAIRFARESDWPFIGTCGGFQHAVIEYARNALGFEDAKHAEYDPYASELFISALSCSLVGQTMSVRLQHGSRAAGFYGGRVS